MEKIYAINNIEQALLWLFDKTGKNWTKTELVEFILQTGWHNGFSEGITLLASAPGWIMPGVGELDRISPDGRVSNSIITDGLIRVNDAVLQSILNHGEASLMNCTGVMNAPFVGIENLRITRDELLRLLSYINQESAESDFNSEKQKISVPVDWKTKAKEIGERIYNKNKHWNMDKIAEKTHQEMKRLNLEGETGVTGRGGRVPEAETIKRHALTGLRT